MLGQPWDNLLEMYFELRFQKLSDLQVKPITKCFLCKIILQYKYNPVLVTGS